MASGHGSKMGHKREAAIAALLSEPTLAQAAARVPMPPRTLRDWLARDAGFIDAYRQARQQILDQTISRLVSITSKAVDTLENILTEGKPGEQTRAALGILTQATRGVELLDLAERVRRLEEAQP